MTAISGIDLARVNDNATKAFQKAAEARVTDYLRGKLVQLHNEQCKARRLRDEAEQVEARTLKLQEQIAAIRCGDWNAIEVFEISDSPAKAQ